MPQVGGGEGSAPLNAMPEWMPRMAGQPFRRRVVHMAREPGRERISPTKKFLGWSLSVQ